MKRVMVKTAVALSMLWALATASVLHAQLGLGTWVRQSPSTAGTELVMTVEACCAGGRRLIYRVGDAGPELMTIESPLDGTDVPVLAAGKPTGQTMGIKRVDDRHTTTVLKMNGRTFGTSKATLSADGRTLTVENDVSVAGADRAAGKQTEIWVRR
jgi:hypothetical protein